MADIFISYAKEDRRKARTLAEEFEKVGWTVWWDRDIPAGETFAEYIKKQLDSAPVCGSSLVCKVGGQQVGQEGGKKSQRPNKLIPVLVENVTPPWVFEDIQTRDLTLWGGEADADNFPKLVSDMTRLLGDTPNPSVLLTEDPVSPSKPTSADPPKPSEPDQTDKKSNVFVHKWMVIALVMVLAITVTWWTYRDGSPEEIKYALTIESEPSDALVKILNNERRYQPGMMLEPGRYQVEVSRKGYITKTEWVELTDRELSWPIALEPIRFALTIRPEPNDATVTIRNVKANYEPGMMLEPGRYQVEVSRKGYITKTEWVELTDRELSWPIALEPIRFALTIRPEPNDATVTIRNVKANYEPGMMLEPGRYQIEVSRKGYITKTEWVELTDRSLIHIALEKVSPAFIVGQVFQRL